jgi:antitoxin FitA
MNVLIRDLDDETVETLKKRASERNRSLQAELKAIVEEAAAQDWSKTWAAADRIFEELLRSGQKFSDTTALLREDRDR